MAARWRGRRDERVTELEKQLRERDPALAERLLRVVELMTSLRDTAARVAELERQVVGTRHSTVGADPH